MACEKEMYLLFFKRKCPKGSEDVQHYSYYRCRNNCNEFGNVKRDLLNKQFVELLQSISPSKGTVDLFETIIIDVWKNKQKTRTNEKKRINREISKLKEKRSKADDLVLKGDLDANNYKRLMADIDADLFELEFNLVETETELSDLGNCVKYCKNILIRPADVWQKSDIDIKSRFQRLVFPKGLEYLNGFFGTKEMSLIFNVLQNKNVEISTLASPP